MRGYFSMGVEGISKAHNVGNLVRTSHAFGAHCFFAVDPVVNIQEIRQTDTSGAWQNMPFYTYDSIEALDLPRDCSLVGIELVDESIALPSFRHPRRAAYILGPEMGNLSDAAMDRCDFVVQIPMSFCVNVGVAGAIVMYDRMISLGRFAERPVRAGGPGPTEALPEHTHGMRRKVRTDRA